MRLNSIRLRNVRRFVDPVQIDGLGPGVNVLSAPNEQGKSTFFDALHAAFFIPHRSMNAEVRSLIPHSGGDPEVTVTFTGIGTGDTWRLEKRWSRKDARRSAMLWRGETLVAQAGQAEDRLASLLVPPAAGGPAGLLWVRQGVTGLNPKGDEAAARQTLLTSVAGEVDAVTGGRQMDAVRARVQEALDLHLTSTGKPRKDGPLQAAQSEVAERSERHCALTAASHALAEALAKRRRLRSELAGVSAPEEVQARAEAVNAAELAFEQGEKHAGGLETARLAERTAALALASAKERLEGFETAARHAQTTADTHAEAAKAHLLAQADHRADEETHAKAAAALTRIREAATEARKLYQRAVEAERGRAAEQRRAELTRSLANAEAARQALEIARAEAATGMSAKALATLRQRHTDLKVARLTRDRAAPAITLHYDGTARVRRGGEALPGATRIAVPDGADLTLDGIGRLSLHPGTSPQGDDVAHAETALADALAQVGMADLAAAERSAQAQQDALTRARDAQARLDAAAPDGIDTLRQTLAGLPGALPDDELPGIDEAQANEAQASEALAKAEAREAAARRRQDAARVTLTRADLAMAAAQDSADRAAAALAAFGPHDETRNALEAMLTDARRALTDATARRGALEAAAPDFDGLRAARERARQAVENATAERHRLEIALSKLDTQIDAHAGAAIEEDLAESADLLALAQQRLAALEEECEILRRLALALDTARGRARDQYVAPVLRELAPLVRMLWPEAELRLDADTVLPSKLVRRGTDEAFEILSGGTREQIALLVRLAFARMLARDGRPAPVILDDAIVYSDDDRIVTMFDALTRQAEDLQVIVFSCRQRAFRDLGGRSLSIAPAAAGRD